MNWKEHFIWSADKLRLLPQAEIGKVTIELLKLNRERILQIRRDDILINRHPPESAAIQNSA